MAENLVVVESPAKAKTINKFLGKNFLVKASMGHVKDLPKSRLGVDPEKRFEPHYITIRSRSKILKELKALAKKSKHVYLATDPDREGEAIGWHLANELKCKGNEVSRILFNEITKKAVQGAMKAPRPIDMQLVGAQQARRVLDRLVGYSLSPLLWKSVRRGLSAGRVQSVAVRLVCEREDEIEAFKADEYWELNVDLQAQAGAFGAQLASLKGEKAERVPAAVAQALAAELPGLTYRVASLQKKEQRRNPQAPFTTSTMQQEASRRLHFTAKKTMMIAQQLYEGLEIGAEGLVGLITYMRTDSVRVADEAQAEARDLIRNRFGAEYLPEKAPVYKSKKQSQDAHEAVRPSSSLREPRAVAGFLSPDQSKLYRLIWSRFVASQMVPAVFDSTQVEVLAARSAGDAVFKASGSVLKFDGWLAAAQVDEKPKEAAEDDEADDAADEKGQKREKILPVIVEGEALTYLKGAPSQHFTQPPPRFNDATLVKSLEEFEIGRPSTYAPIISTILDRQYVDRIEGGRLKPSELGRLINGILVKHFQDVLNAKFTAAMEAQLDKVEEGQLDWQDAVAFFYEPFLKHLDVAKELLKDMKKDLEVVSDVVCEKCGALMVVKWGRHGKFLACPTYPVCKNTKPLEEGPDGKITQAAEPTEKLDCEKCGKPMVMKTGRFGRFMACSGYPECKTTKALRETVGLACPKCADGQVVTKRSRKGRTFYGCDKYPACDFVSWGKPIEGSCPSCGAKYLVEKYSKRDGASQACATEGCGYRKGGQSEGADSPPAEA